MQLLKKLFRLDAGATKTGLVIAILYLLFTILPIPAASPFLRFGMFSTTHRQETEFEVLKLYVNGQAQSPRYYTIMQWDDLTGPFYQWKNEQNPQYQPLLYKRKLLKKLKADPSVIPDARMRNQVDDQSFINWYARQINIIYGQKPDSFRIAAQVYRWQNGMIPVTAEQNLLSYE